MKKVDWTNERYILFEYRFEDTVTKKMIPAESSLDNVLPAFGEFLKGCGYNYDGEVNILEAEDVKEPGS